MKDQLLLKADKEWNNPELQEELKRRLSKMDHNAHWTARTMQQFGILHDFLLVPCLYAVVNETGIVHKSEVHSESYTARERYAYDTVLYRHIQKRPGLKNAILRFFCTWEKCLKIRCSNQQLWVIEFYFPYYYLLAVKLKEQFDEKLRAVFKKDCVVVDGTK